MRLTRLSAWVLTLALFGWHPLAQGSTRAASSKGEPETFLYGGSFDPVQNGHVALMRGLLRTSPRARVVVVPAFQHAKKRLTKFGERVAMLKIATKPLGPRVSISRIEEKLGGISYTVRTLEALLARRPGRPINLVLAADVVEELPTFHRWQDIRQLISDGRVKLTVVPRGDLQPPASIDGVPVPAALRMPLPVVSSTEVRTKVGRGESVAALVPPGVPTHIRKQRLYQP